MTGDYSERLVMPTVVIHPSPSFRHGLSAALNTELFDPEEPDDLGLWVQLDHRRLVLVMEGMETEALENHHPETIVVVLVQNLDVNGYRRALAAGADGVAHVDAHPSTIAHVAEGAANGEVIIPAEVARQLAGRPRPAELELSGEEERLLQRISEGASVVQISQEMYLAERSVRRRLQNIYIRLGVNGRAEALKRAGQLGLVD